MSVEIGNGEVCPLRRGNAGVGFSNVVDDGGAEEDEVSNLVKICKFFYDARSQ